MKRLQTQVAKLTRVAMNRINYTKDDRIDCYTAAGLDSYDARPLLKFDQWTRVFGTDADDEVNKQAIIRSLKCNWRFNTNEPDNRTFSLFVVSLKDEASQLLTNSGVNDGTLAPLTSGTHYIAGQDRTLLNLKFFNVHYHRRWTAGVYPMAKAATGAAGAVQNIPNVGIDSQRLGTFNLNFGKKGMLIKNPNGDWKAGVYPKDPSKNYFLMIFWTGDSIIDGEYGALKYDTIVSVDVSA